MGSSAKLFVTKQGAYCRFFWPPTTSLGDPLNKTRLQDDTGFLPPDVDAVVIHKSYLIETRLSDASKEKQSGIQGKSSRRTPNLCDNTLCLGLLRAKGEGT